MKALTASVVRVIGDDDGQDLIEYALLSAFLALVVIAGATLLGAALNNWYAATGGGVNSHAASAS